MSRIDDLIRQHCPNGVEFRALGEVTTRGSNIKWGKGSDEEFRYIDLSSVDRVTRRIGETAVISSGDAPSRAQQIVHEGDVLFATTRPTQMRWAVIPPAYDGQIASTGYCVLRPIQTEVLTSFLAHLLGAERFRQYVQRMQVPGNYPSIPDSLVRRFRVPVPPMEVQTEIVRVLDLFQSLEAELEAELEARRRQYAHYRDSLLTFNEQGVRWMALGDLGEIYRGRRFVKNDYVAEGLPAIHYGELYTHYGKSAAHAVTHVRSELEPSLRFAEPGDVVIAEVGETVEDVGKATAWLGDTNVAIHDGCYGFRHSMNPVFVAYCLQTASYHDEKAQYVARGKVKRLSINGIRQVRIPVPPLDEQERIVAILDSFDALVNDLSVGLPAELAARRKQYEYYRDRLLTFEEAA